MSKIIFKQQQDKVLRNVDGFTLKPSAISSSPVRTGLEAAACSFKEEVVLWLWEDETWPNDDVIKGPVRGSENPGGGAGASGAFSAINSRPSVNSKQLAQ